MPRIIPGRFYFCLLLTLFHMAGYSGTPLQKKLGIKPGMKIYVSHAPKEYFDWISPIPEDVSIATKPGKGTAFIHLFVQDRKVFENEFRMLMKNLTKEGMLWVSWPKKSSRMETDLDENIIREFGLKEGLVDVKVCAVDAVWSGLKFVYRIKDR
jgi:hypothetical protein